MLRRTLQSFGSSVSGQCTEHLAPSTRSSLLCMESPTEVARAQELADWLVDSEAPGKESPTEVARAQELADWLVDSEAPAVFERRKIEDTEQDESVCDDELLALLMEMGRDDVTGDANDDMTDADSDQATIPDEVVFGETTDVFLTDGMEDHCMRISSASFSDLAEHAIKRIKEMRNGLKLPLIKVGITTNPMVRFEYYKEDDWQIMWLLLCSPVLKDVEDLEIALISRFKNTSGCQNIRDGGDGGLGVRFPNMPFYYTYYKEVCGQGDCP